MTRPTVPFTHDAVTRLIRAATKQGLTVNRIVLDHGRVELVVNSGESGEKVLSPLADPGRTENLRSLKDYLVRRNSEREAGG